MLLLIDKPKGITSHDVVDRVREVTGERRVGHGGTLDPNATGLLVIGITREGTKRLVEFTKGKDKVYEAEILLGEERDTHDAEGEIRIKSLDLGIQGLPDKNRVVEVLESFVGEQEQIPPAHSAVKIKGKKAYQLAREGKEVEIEPRKVTIHSIELLEYDYPVLKIRTKVSSGTYIRSLARDIGRTLGTYGYLKELRRTRIGEYDISKAVRLEDLTVGNWTNKTFN